MRSSLIILFLMLIVVSAKSQKWQPGYFNDTKNNKVEGLIQTNPSGKGPIKGEGFIVFKESDKASEIKLSASDIKWFVAGKDSFVVAHPPIGQTWPNELDFVRVIVDEPLRLYAYRGGKGGGSGVHLSPGIGVGVGGGSYAGGGLGISFGGGGGGKNKVTYYYGVTTAELADLTPENFEDVMSEIMGDEPQVVDAIHAHKFALSNIDKLIAYFKQVKASHQ